MGRYRKRPVVIEARQLTPESAEALIKWCGGLPIVGSSLGVNGITIKTLEGPMTARHGDWIIEGVNGEFYPCKDDIFRKSYDLVGGTD